jgi:ketosteroid isomerase-like protein
MSEGRQALERLYEAWNRDDLGGVIELFAADAEARTSGDFPGISPVYRGHDGLRQYWRDFNQMWESIEVRTERYEDHGARTLALFRFVGHGRGGVPAEREGGHLVVVRNGVIADFEAFGSWDAALTVAVVRELYDAWNRRDVAHGIELTHPDVEFHPSGEYPGLTGVYRGRERMRDVFEDLAGFFEDLTVRVDELRPLGNHGVLVLYTFIGHGRDGVPVERAAAQVVEVEDGLVRSMRTFGSWEAARAAAGLDEPGGHPPSAVQ